MDEQLLTAVLVAPFVITMIGFAVAISFAPGVPNEIAPATEHDHEEMDHGGGPGREACKAETEKEIERTVISGIGDDGMMMERVLLIGGGNAGGWDCAGDCLGDHHLLWNYIRDDRRRVSGWLGGVLEKLGAR